MPERLIDADKLEVLLTKVRTTLNWQKYRDARDLLTRDNMLLNFEQIVHLQPTVDAVRVVHGEWIEARVGEMLLYPDGQKMCSECKTIMPSAWKVMPPYCLNCGAKMDGEKGENTV